MERHPIDGGNDLNPRYITTVTSRVWLITNHEDTDMKLEQANTMTFQQLADYAIEKLVAQSQESNQ